MKAKLFPYILRYGPIVNLLLVAVLLIYIAISVSWAVALLMSWMAYSISSFTTGLNKFRAELLYKIKAVKDYARQNQGSFNEFIDTVNKQAEEFKKHGTKCIECGKYPGQIRNGSIHNSADPNCQMHQAPPFKDGDKLQVPPELLKEDTRPNCTKCKEEGRPDLHYQNNCPIHD